MIFHSKNGLDAIGQQHILHKFGKDFEFVEDLSPCFSAAAFLDHQSLDLCRENATTMSHPSNL